MRKEDVTQVSEIDREAFPTQWPPPNFRHDLQRRLTYYMVAFDNDKTVNKPEVKSSGWGRLFGFYPFFNNKSPSTGHYIVGYVGLWVLADEAHITSIAVREAYRQRGIGELLLISGISLATELKARIVTLEVRSSNLSAQNLYAKYSFNQVGVRRGYYPDDREDGILMSTEDITLAPFQAHFQHLRQVHSDKWGITLNQVQLGRR
ncbi:ribosomal protein S18-alanine N-acetyltransferase [Chloroflexota bacterium]